DFRGGKRGVVERLLAGLAGAIKDRARELLKRREGQVHEQDLRPDGGCAEEGKSDARAHGGGGRDLGRIGRFYETLARHAIIAEVDALLLLEFRGDVVQEGLVDVVATEVRVAVGGLHFEDAIAELEERDVEGAAAKVIDGDLLVLLLLETIGKRRG